MSAHSNPSSPTSRPEANRIDEASRTEAQIGRYLLTAAAVILVLVLGLGGWSALTSVDGAVVASGLVAAESDSRSVQHLDGGIISEILVRDGDRVDAGDELMLLDAAQFREQIQGLQAQIAAAREESNLLANEMQSLTELEAKGLVTKTRITALKRQKAKADGEFGRLSAEQARAQNNLARISVRAPISGTIHNLAFHTLGGVVAPGQEILKIVPADDRMVVAARLNPADIDQVFRGQSVSVRLPGLDMRTVPELPGRVDTVSADLSFDEKLRSSFYEVRIVLEDDMPAELDNLELVPGMPADAFIRTRSRTVLSYLLQPVTDQLTRAFRER
ncbi:MAG TPA: HlyD family efflux transporter periplasmic adaptor subunit [Afifellaceae bacterium]|nr:HlyD family efflux transporter periplasmic adaptor subunit [Afifellaceae bacterium]